MKTNTNIQRLTIVFLLVNFLLTCSLAVNAHAKKISVTITKKSYHGSDESCYGANDAQLTISASGGAGSYQYSIDNGATFSSNNVFSNLATGQNYVVVVKDKDGTTSTAEWIWVSKVSNPVTPQLYYVKNASNANAKDGYISSGAWGGTDAISFSIDNGVTFQPTGMFENLGGGIYTIIAKDKNGCIAMLQQIKVNPVVQENKGFIWKGLSNNWNDANNWMSAKIPSVNDDVTIAVTANNPLINGSGFAKNVTIENGAQLQVTGVLYLGNTISAYASNSVDATEGTIDFSGSAIQELNGNVFVNNSIKDITLGNNVNLSGKLDVYGKIIFSANNKTFNTNDYLTLKSTAEGTAQVGKILNGNSITGNVTVEQYFPARKGWKFLSVSTQSEQTIHAAWQEGEDAGNTTGISGYGIQLTGTVADWKQKGFDAQSPAPAIKTYNSNTNLWVGVTSTMAPFSDPSNAYMVFIRGDRSANAVNSPETPTVLRSKGVLKSGDQTQITVPAGKFVAIGNPYPSDIDLSKVETSNDMFFYIWDPNLGNSYGAYQTIVRISNNEYMAIPGGGSYENISENIIPAGQAFFVYNSDGGTVRLTENARAGKGNAFSGMNQRQMGMTGNAAADQLKVKLYTVNNDGSTKLVDGIFQKFNEGYSNEIDGDDAVKSANTGENLSVKRSGKLLAIESRSLNTNEDTTSLNLTGVSYTNYRFQIDFSKFIDDYDVILVDNFTSKRTWIKNGEPVSYDFSVISNAASYASNRFYIVYVPRRTMPVTFTSVKAEKKNESVDVSWTIGNEVNVVSYIIERSNDGAGFNQAGTVSASEKSAYHFTDINPASGLNYYRVVSVDIDGKKMYSPVVKMNVELAEDAITVSPNPIVGNNVNLNLKLQDKGIYYISIRNQMGQVVDNRQVDFNGNQARFIINPASKLSSGVYTIEVAHPSGGHSVVRFIK